MINFDSIAFKQMVDAQLAANQNERIFRFEYQGEFFWVKQPEKLHGIWHLLKPHPKKAFAEEIAILKAFMQINAPVPNLVASGEDFLVLEDAGVTIARWLEDKTVSEAQKMQILQDGVQALIDLHRRDLVHGRPALRDMTWKAGKVLFIDFESHSNSQNLLWKQVRDGLIFIHSLGRSKVLSDKQMRAAVDYYAQHCDAEIWQNTVNFVVKWRCLYHFLLIFKPIAKMDLIAIYRVFEHLLPELRTKLS
ncbi:protein kinase family protein [[Pasteurella] aerogenes]|nr:protein kinase family protein [[Pasteurella] aerogenes]